MRPNHTAIGVIFVAALLICACLVKAEQAKPLTNADVAGMVKAGLPESTVILAIQMAGERAWVNFDTSPAALIELRKAGASEKILNAVLWTQRLAPKRPTKSSEISAAPGLPVQPGVYYRSGSSWVALHSSLLWPPYEAPWNITVGFRRRKEYGVPLSGLHARAQISQPQPTLYLREPPSVSGWQLLRLAIRKDHRELRVVSGDSFFSEIAFQPSASRGIEVKSLGANVFSVRPSAALDPGEYLLCARVASGPRLLQCYEFGITAEKPPSKSPPSVPSPAPESRDPQHNRV